MKLRSMVLLGTGVAIGLMASRKMREDDPNIVVGPSDAPGGRSAAG